MPRISRFERARAVDGDPCGVDRQRSG